MNTAVGDEGGFAPNLNGNEEAILLIIDAIKTAGYKPGKDIYIALDVAASEFYSNKGYNFEGKLMSAEKMVSYYEKLAGNIPYCQLRMGYQKMTGQGGRYSHRSSAIRSSLLETISL